MLMPSQKLPKTITTQELMELDYRYHYSDEELWKDYQRLVQTHEYKQGAQFKPGMKLCQNFCPNFWDIENIKGLSFAKAWKDPILMDKVRVWGLSGMSNLWLSWIRRAVFLTAGLPNSSFYRPHFSKQIIEMTRKSEGIVFDPCAGWGGRMLGTIASGWKYIACEPNVETYRNLLNMINFIRHQSYDSISDVDLLNIPAENFSYDKERVDVIVTSPPYFNLEVYNHDSMQSYHKYQTYSDWRDQWLIPLITNCCTLLKSDGLSAWNVMNVGKYDLVGDVIRTHETLGWSLVETVGFNSPLANIRKLKNKDVTYIFSLNK